ncbi:MAG: hypothetical protein HY259_08380 [Chloroflexi bacterium]|nr:hypothetical protein [Chloroflexota bacterium]MBI3733456.1 hypothetical protein [Chloroflexota bacterium]
MAYAVADILLFILLLAGLWLALFYGYRWLERRRERQENAQLIRMLENGLNKQAGTHKEGPDA